MHFLMVSERSADVTGTVLMSQGHRRASTRDVHPDDRHLELW